MSKVDVLLSICVPTYNRVELLRHSLPRLIMCANRYPQEVELIVSDNCSSDGTQNFVCEEIDGVRNARYSRNGENIGPDGNHFHLTNDLALGKYCWIVGDDDLISVPMVDVLISSLKESDPDFVRLGYSLGWEKEVLVTPVLASSSRALKMSFSRLTDYKAERGNLLNTFISATVFRLAPFRECVGIYQRPIDLWENARTLFPNVTIFLKVFGQSQNCLFIPGSMVFAKVHEKDWDERLAKFSIAILPELYEEYRRCLGRRNRLPLSLILIIEQALWYRHRGLSSYLNQRLREFVGRHRVLSVFVFGKSCFLTCAQVILKRLKLTVGK